MELGEPTQNNDMYRIILLSEDLHYRLPVGNLVFLVFSYKLIKPEGRSGSYVQIKDRRNVLFAVGSSPPPLLLQA